MAGVAFDLGVRAAQRKFGFGVVVENRLLPFCLPVAALAFFAVAAAMNILQLVAGRAVLGEVFINLADMTGGAGHVLVSALEWKFRFAVIERLCLAPFGGGMTAVTFLAEPPLMRIIRFVAIETNRRRLVKRLFRGMA